MKKDDWMQYIDQLESGQIRSSTFNNISKQWETNTELREQILEMFKQSPTELRTLQDFSFSDKGILFPSRPRGTHQRIVPGGTSIRPGVFLGKNVIVMPPSFINIGAYVGEDTMVDSHVLVGSCAYIGARVHLSAGVSIGGVLEPANSRGVIIEDDVFVGAHCAVVEGVLVKKRAILGLGVQLGASTPIYDLVNERQISFEEGIPENAIVIPGSRSLNTKSNWAQELGLQSSCAIIIKYRNASSKTTNSKVELEMALRGSGDE